MLHCNRMTFVRLKHIWRLFCDLQLNRMASVCLEYHYRLFCYLQCNRIPPVRLECHWQLFYLQRNRMASVRLEYHWWQLCCLQLHALSTAGIPLTTFLWSTTQTHSFCTAGVPLATILLSTTEPHFLCMAGVPMTAIFISTISKNKNMWWIFTTFERETFHKNYCLKMQAIKIVVVNGTPLCVRNSSQYNFNADVVHVEDLLMYTFSYRVHFPNYFLFCSNVFNIIYVYIIL